MAGSWLGAVPVLLGLVALLVLVGGSIGLALRWPLRDIALAAPSLGAVTLLGCGVIVRVVGVPWTPVGAAVAVLLCTGAARVISRHALGSPGVESDAPGARTWWGWVAAGLGVSAVGAAVPYVVGIEGPRSISTMADTSFHLAAARLLSSERSGSLLDAGGVLWNTPFLYPGGFQALAATLVAWFGTDPATSSHAVMLVCVCLVFPTGLMLLARWLQWSPAAVAGTGAASAAFGAAPFWLTWFGPLWSNLLALSLVPLLLAIVVMLTSQARPLLRQAPLVLLLLAVACGICGAQPSALYGAFLVGVPLAVSRVRQSGRDRRATRRWIIGISAASVILLVATVSMPPSFILKSSGPEPMSWRRAILSGVSLGDTPYPVQIPVLLLQGAGVWYALRTRQRWAIWAWGVVAVFAGSAAVVKPSILRILTWPWWNMTDRILAYGVIPAALLVGLGSQWLVERLESRGVLVRMGERVGTVLPLILVAATIAMSVPFRVAPLRDWYPHGGDPGSVRGVNGLRNLEPLAGHMSEGAVVAMDPWLGGQYLYLATGRRALFPQPIRAVNSGDAQLLGEQIDRLATDPQVCRAVRRLSVTYVITGGENVEIPENDKAWYAGIARVATTGGFVRVADSGPYTLWEVPQCRES